MFHVKHVGTAQEPSSRLATTANARTAFRDNDTDDHDRLQIHRGATHQWEPHAAVDSRDGQVGPRHVRSSLGLTTRS